MPKVLTIQPVTRIEGHARITIHLDDAGNVADTRLHIMSLRGFEKFIEGRPAEEIPRIVTRICGICPWMHHLASCKAVEGCFGVTPTPAGHILRELCHLIAHCNDKILHFFFLAAPDFLPGSENNASIRSVIGLAKKMPELARQVARMRQVGQQMLNRFAGRAIHPVASVIGGFAKPMVEEERLYLLDNALTLLDFACFAFDFARKNIFVPNEDLLATLGAIRTGFLGTVDQDGALRLYDGRLRLMRPNGALSDFSSDSYREHISEQVADWSYGKMPYAACWKEGFSLNPNEPLGVYRVNTLARLNVCDYITTPRAQEALEEFRGRFGRPAQATMLFHWARLIELLYTCERTVELLKKKETLGSAIRAAAPRPRAGRGVGCVEAPRGTLIHDYTTDENGLIVKANMIVGTTHNLAPMNMSVRQAANSLIREGRYDEAIFNKIEMAVRAYDP